MKSRLSGTIWMLTIFNGLALFAVLCWAWPTARGGNRTVRPCSKAAG